MELEDSKAGKQAWRNSELKLSMSACSYAARWTPCQYAPCCGRAADIPTNFGMYSAVQAVDRKTKLTHIIAGDDCVEKLPLTSNQIQRRHILVVAPEWLQNCLAQSRHVSEDKFQIHLQVCCESGNASRDQERCARILLKPPFAKASDQHNEMPVHLLWLPGHQI